MISGSLIKNLGRAIVAILHQPELTLNERICLADATFTQQEVLALLEKYSDTKWTVQHVTTEETLKNAQEEWTKGNMMNAEIAFILGLAYSGTDACNFEDKIKNKALGLERVSLKQIVYEAFQRNETTGYICYDIHYNFRGKLHKNVLSSADNQNRKKLFAKISFIHPFKTVCW